MVQKVELRKERRLLERVSLTFDFVRENFGVLGKALLLVAGPILALIAIFVAFVTGTPDMAGMGEGWFRAEVVVKTFAGSLIPMLVGTSVVCTLVYGYFILYDEDGPAVTFEQLMRKSRGLWPRVFLMFLLFTVIIVPLAIVSVFLLMIPFLWIILPLNLGFFASIKEKSGIGGFFRRGFELVYNNWFDTLGLSICVYVVVYSLGSIFSIPAVVYAQFLVFQSLENGGSFEGNFIYNLLQTFYLLSAQLIYGFVFVAIGIQYYHLSEKKDNVGLIREIEKVGSEIVREEEAGTGRTEGENFSF